MKITFQKWFPYSGTNGQEPLPAKRVLPEWFQRMPQFIHGEKKFRYMSGQRHNATSKWCMPLLDSYNAGYVIRLPYDIIVELVDGHPEVNWRRGPESLIGNHSLDQIPDKLIPEGYHKIAFKFLNEWSAQLPAGYSAIYTHPLNRWDLPFRSLAGIVENDSYHVPVAFPFFLRKDFEGVIEAGTPIAQVIPFKREGWTHELKEYDANYATKQDVKFFGKLYRSYKNQAWKRKDYN